MDPSTHPADAPQASLNFILFGQTMVNCDPFQKMKRQRLLPFLNPCPNGCCNLNPSVSGMLVSVTRKCALFVDLQSSLFSGIFLVQLTLTGTSRRSALLLPCFKNACGVLHQQRIHPLWLFVLVLATREFHSKSGNQRSPNFFFRSLSTYSASNFPSLASQVKSTTCLSVRDRLIGLGFGSLWKEDIGLSGCCGSNTTNLSGITGRSAIRPRRVLWQPL